MSELVIRVNGRRLPRWGFRLNDAGRVDITRAGVVAMYLMLRLPPRGWRPVSRGGQRFARAGREVTFDYEAGGP